MTVATPAADPAESIVLEVAGLRITLRVPAELARQLEPLWEHLRVQEEPGAGSILLEFDYEKDPARQHLTPVNRHPSASYVLSGRVTREVIRSLLGQRLLLHAGAVEHQDLGTVVMVGASGAGKSTATTRLGQAGLYLTDELTILDPHSFAITPYPKPISKHPAGETSKTDIALAELGLVVGIGGAAPQMVVFLERDAALAPGEGTARRIPLADALLRLIGQSSSLWKVPGGLAALAELITSTGGGLAVSYAEADELESILRAAPAPVQETYEVLDRGDGEQLLGMASEQRGDASGLETFCAAPFAQSLALEDGVLVIGERQAVHLPGLTGVVWELLRESTGLTEAQLMQRLIEEHGEHPDAARWLQDALARLLNQGWALRA